MTTSENGTIKVFFSYAHEDEKLRDELAKRLAMLVREGVVASWHDRQISGGKEWAAEIDQNLNDADLILLLVSPDFLASNYCYEVEMERAMERHEDKSARVIPIILRPCDWENALFGKLQAFPSDVLPVTKWADIDDAFLDIVNGIRKVAAELAPQSNAEGEIARIRESLRARIPNRLVVGFVARRDRDGRDIFERLRDELAPGRNHLVVLWGAGGVGKTELAAETARSLTDTHRVIWVSADGRESFTFSNLLDEIASPLGREDLRPLTVEVKQERVREALGASPTLVVLDNFETIAPIEQDHCVNWLSQLGVCCSLITTRQKLEGHRNVPIPSMELEEARDFLKRLIEQAHDPESFTNLDYDRVIKTADANPLILHWVLAQIDLAQDPKEVLDDLAHGEGDAAERVFSRSFDLPQLASGGRDVLLALSLFAPSGTRPAVAEVAGMGAAIKRKQFNAATRALASLWLVRAIDNAQRLTVEGLTRQLAKAKLEQDPRAKVFWKRHIRRYRNHLRNHLSSTPGDLAALESEKDNLLNVIDDAFHLAEMNVATEVFNDLNNFFQIRGYWDETVQWGEKLLKAAHREGNHWAAAQVSNHLAVVFSNRGENSKARKLFRDIVDTAGEHKNQSLLANSLTNLGSLARTEGNRENARKLLTEGLEVARASESRGDIIVALRAIGNFEQMQGNIEAARKFLEEALNRARKSWGPLFVDPITLAMGWLDHEEGKLDQAKEYYELSLTAARKLDDRQATAIALDYLGYFTLETGDLAQARNYCLESLDISSALGMVKNKACSLHHLAIIELREGELQRAADLLSESVELFDQLGDKENLVESLETCGELRLAEGRIEDAEECLMRGLSIAESIGYRIRIARIKYSLGILEEVRGDRVVATKMFQEAIELFESLKSSKLEEVRKRLARVAS